MVKVTIIKDHRNGTENYPRSVETLHSVPQVGTAIVLDGGIWEVEELFYIGSKLLVQIAYCYPVDQEAYLEPEDYE